ncbi:MAG TPA: SPOR domain-containing protein, partial [Thalassobaculum sp.]
PAAAGAPAVTVATAGTPTGTVETVPVGPTDIWIQVGSFESRGNAGNLSRRMRSFGPAQIQEAAVAGKTFYRVRIGPMSEVAAADGVLERVIAAGYPGSRIIVE